MTTVNELTDETFHKVAIARNAFPMARYFFDLHIGEDGIHAYYMWKQNDFRFPIYHHFVDFMKRRARGNKNRNAAISVDPKNVFIPYEDIQGLVTYRDHKEIQLLSTSEQIYFIFRPFDDYDRFVAYLKERVPDKYFTRDDVEIEDTVYIS